MDREACWATGHRVTNSQTLLNNSHVPINYEMTTISILAASHRLPSSKLYISSRLLCPPLVHLLEGADKNPACRDAEGLSAQWA